MADERQICCCGASGWTRVIAWFQIIGAVVSIIVMALAIDSSRAFLALDAGGTKAAKAAMEIGAAPTSGLAANISAEAERTTVEQMQAMRTFTVVILTTSAFLLIGSIVEFFMGIVLLRGSLKKDPYLIHIWVAYTAILLSIWVSLNLMECVFATNGTQVAMALIEIIFMLIIEGFCLWVVMTHKNELEDSGGRVFSVKV